MVGNRAGVDMLMTMYRCPIVQHQQCVMVKLRQHEDCQGVLPG